MGGKPIGAGQQVLLCLTLLSLVSGCSYLSDLRDRAEIRDAMVQGQTLFARGDFSGSLKEYQRVQSLAQEASPSDAASFTIALIYADPRNPQKDNQKAMGGFQGVIARYPESSWADQSRIWIAAFDDLARAQREIRESKQELEKSRQALEKSRQVDIEIEQKRRIRGK